jgi:hypothetical protein
MNVMTKNFRPATYQQLAAEYPCIVVPTNIPLDREDSLDLFQFKPDQCMVEGIYDMRSAALQ